MKAIYEFNWDCGRMGGLDGIFIAEKPDIEALIGEEIYFGEVLGKHSEILGILETTDLTMKTDDQEFITKFEAIMGTGTISGFNPLDYYDADDANERDDVGC